MESVELRQVSRIYGRSFALHRVSMRLEAGDALGLLGGNGAGKTTLLNILATLERPSRGRVLFGGRSWREVARRGRRAIGWVSHDSLLYGDLTGLENLAFYGRMYGLARPEELAQRWMERVGLREVADSKRVHAYSRGMRQRLTLARALLHEPSLLLLDEPLTGLDQQGRAEVLTLLQELRGQGKIMIVVTHDLQRLDALVDEIAILRRGKLAHRGPATDRDAILDAYARFA